MTSTLASSGVPLTSDFCFPGRGVWTLGKESCGFGNPDFLDEAIAR